MIKKKNENKINNGVNKLNETTKIKRKIKKIGEKWFGF